MDRARGFTLIELLIVVTVISILAAIAFPAYDSYVRRANRTLAKAQLNEIASLQESFFVERKTYSLNLQDLNTSYPGSEGDPIYISKNGKHSSTQTKYSLYKIELVSPTAVSFTIQATALNVQAKDTDCTTMTLDNLGQRTPANNDCWTR